MSDKDEEEVRDEPSSASPAYLKRKIDVGTKLLLAREAQAASINAVAKKYDLSRENVRRWIRCEAQLEAAVARQQQLGGDAPITYRLNGGGRKISYEAMEVELADKVLEHRASDGRVTRRMIADWANEMKTRLQVDVVVCPTWISRFMKRNGISLTTSGAVAPTNSGAPDQQRPKRLTVSAEDKLAVLAFFERSNRDMQQTLLQFYGHIANPKVKQVKARNIYNWLHKRDELALRVHKDRLKNEAAAAGDHATSSDTIGASDTGGDVNASRQCIIGAVRGLSNLHTTTGSEHVSDASGSSCALVGYDGNYEYGDNGDNTLDEDDQDLLEDDGAPRRVFNYTTVLGEEGRADDEQQQRSTEANPMETSMAPPPFPLPRPLPKIYVPPRAKRRQPADLSTEHPATVVESHPQLSAEPFVAVDGPEQEHQLELRKRKLEIQERQVALKEQKDKLLNESIRCNNVLKRIRIAEENMLARKRLKDAGVSQQEIDELMPVVHINGDL